MQQHKPRLLRLRRNPNYLSSARIALEVGLWWAPTALFQTLKRPVLNYLAAILAVIVGTVGVAFTLVMFVTVRLGIIVAGLAGFLVEVPADEAETILARVNNQG